MERPDHSGVIVLNRKRAPWELVAALFLIGFTAIVAQIVLMRELMVVFNGNEMSLGLMLASWLLWTAIGSHASGRVVTRLSRPRQLMALLEVFVSATFPFTIFLVRGSKEVFHPVAGEILGPGPMILTCLAALCFFCLLSGGLFAAGCQLCAKEMGTSDAEGASNVYLLEAAGSGIGGALASLALIRYFTAFEICAVMAALNLLAAVTLTTRSGARRKIALGAVAAVFVLVVFPFACPRLEIASLGRLWSGYHLIAARNSVYGNLAIVQTDGSRSLFENGLLVSTMPDPAAAEEAVHFALLEHPLPRSLLLIGGGLNGSLTQALKHSSLERIDYVELDPTVLELAEKYFPSEWALLIANPRVRIHNTDGRLFVKTAENKFDVVIVNLPDPQTAQLNRFYTREFFEEVARKLSPTGVFSIQLKAGEDYISPELTEFLSCINRTLRGVFPDIAVIPGDTMHFFASRRSDILARDSEELLSRLRARHIETAYAREYYLPYRMSLDRMLDLETAIRPQAGTRVNKDFSPIAYYFDVVLWSTQFNQFYRHLFLSIAQVHFGVLALAIMVILLLFASFVRWVLLAEHCLSMSAGFCVATMGFTLISLEILFLLAFQAIHGYVYQELAIIIAAFMVGLALGSGLALRTVANDARVNVRTSVRKLVWLQCLAALSPLVAYAVFHALAFIRSSSAEFWASQILFLGLAVLSGLGGGYQFPIATRIYLACSGNKKSGPGTLYALDLAGACLGAVVLGTFLIPLFGFLRTASFLALVNLAPMVLTLSLALGAETRSDG
jgi:spermidine synthase